MVGKFCASCTAIGYPFCNMTLLLIQAVVTLIEKSFDLIL